MVLEFDTQCLGFILFSSMRRVLQSYFVLCICLVCSSWIPPEFYWSFLGLVLKPFEVKLWFRHLCFVACILIYIVYFWLYRKCRLSTFHHFLRYFSIFPDFMLTRVLLVTSDVFLMDIFSTAQQHVLFFLIEIDLFR